MGHPKSAVHGRIDCRVSCLPRKKLMISSVGYAPSDIRCPAATLLRSTAGIKHLFSTFHTKPKEQKGQPSSFLRASSTPRTFQHTQQQHKCSRRCCCIPIPSRLRNAIPKRSNIYCGTCAEMVAGVCPFHDDPVEAARQALQERVLAQPLATESLSMALSAWHYGYVHTIACL